MNKALQATETRRLEIQEQLDSSKSAAERNVLGQFATPRQLAQDMLSHARQWIPDDEQIRFLEPSLGTGAFYSALLNEFGSGRIKEALAFEIDSKVAAAAQQLWHETPLELKIADFTQASPRPDYNLVIANPPYTRHHHLQPNDKARLRKATFAATGLHVNGLAGLYCYFVGLTHAWLMPGAISGWLLPSEFMDVNYGQILQRYFLEHVTLLQIHRFNPAEVQFGDALVTSAIVWFRNERPAPGHNVLFTYGGTLLKPLKRKNIPVAALANETKWSRFPSAGVRVRNTEPTVSDLFEIRRGLATGNNTFFILSEDELQQSGLEQDAFVPVLPSPRYVQGNEINALADGSPSVGSYRRFLLSTRFPEMELKIRFPGVAKYIDEGVRLGIHEGYLCANRSPWYAIENRPPAPVYCTYMGRLNSATGRPPFRFILNNSRATVTNVYLAMYPKPSLQRALARDPGLLRTLWQVLNDIQPEVLLSEARVYGGGMVKLEPRELARIPLRLPEQFARIIGKQEMLPF